jgi:hypothetical protein
VADALAPLREAPLDEPWPDVDGPLDPGAFADELCAMSFMSARALAACAAAPAALPHW